MKANELMVGDWVLYNGNHQQTLEISGIDDEVYLETDELVHQSEIQPIPLTTEILKKNGFEEGKGGNFCRVLNIDEYKYVLYNFNDSFIYIRNEFYNMDVQIHYVHELQHALKLCGIEKEIILKL